jgi:signal transduction histidine kinase
VNGLRARLWISLMAAALIGLSFTGLAMFGWLHKQVMYKKTLELQTAALAANAASHAQLDNAELLTHLHNVVARFGVNVSFVSPNTKSYIADGGVHVFENNQYVALQWSLSNQDPWILISRPWNKVLDDAFQMQWLVLAVLAAGFGLAALSAIIFLRRSVMEPLSRLTERLNQGELPSFDEENIDDFARLGRGLISMTQKITEDREQISQQLESLRQAHAELELTSKQLVRSERLAAIGKLAASIAHEVGNPLAILGGYVELLVQKRLSSREQEDVFIGMQREIARLQNTIKQLLDFSRTDLGNRQGDVQEALNHLKGLIGMHTKMRDVQLELPESTSMRVPLDSAALVQVLLNLVLNAADVAHKGHVAIGLQQIGEFAQLTVEDSGPGIAPDVLPRIFDPFFTTKPAGEGTGLGLAICERMITACGGEITVGRSEQWGGAKFTVNLPLV